MGNGPLSLPAAPVVSAEDRQSLLIHARRAITAALDSASHLERSVPAQPILVASLDAETLGPLAGSFPVFVSVYHQGNLRGCIGVIKASKPLWDATAEMAVAAATRDPRFSALSKTELADLSIEVSILGRFVDVRPEDRDVGASFVDIGEHGAHLEQGSHGALFLPQVATRFQWSTVEFLDQLARKADLDQGAWLADSARLELFRVTSFRGH
jgi:AmmeMemoRadiSam system protein A